MDQILNDVKFSEAEVLVIMEQNLLALDFLQNQKIVHRDIKPDNILIKSIEDQDYQIRIADMGLAAFTPNDELLY